MQGDNIKKALVVDDSAFMRKIISDFLNSHPYIEVIGTARNGEDAIKKVKELKPDVVTMDIEMPKMSGLEALKMIMQECPVPVVMLSSTTKSGAENTVLAMEFGAVDFIAKPGGAISLNLHEVREEIIEKVAQASGVPISKLTSRLKEPPKAVGKTNELPEQKNIPELGTIKKFTQSGRSFVMIGTSTGGPRALQQVLTKLPATIDAPILIVQHMPAGFTHSLAMRLDGLCQIRVKEAEDGEQIVNGTAYIAAGGKHLKVKRLGTSYFLHLDEIEPTRLGHRPSVNVLLESVSEIKNHNFLTIILTGMGSDGKEGLEKLKRNGRTFAIAESEQTAVVYGMPRAIVESGLADEVVDVHQIASRITEIVKS
jgi:two-component system chemotaxis response regulator CheB